MKFQPEAGLAFVILVSSRPEASLVMVGPPETFVLETKKILAFQTLNFKFSL